MTGTAVSAATYCRKTAVRFLRARQTMPGWTVAHSWKCGLNSTVWPPAATPPVSCVWVMPSLRRENSYESTA